MSQNLDENEIENFISKIIDENQLKELFIMPENSFNKWLAAETKACDDIKAAHSIEQKNMIDLTEESQYMRNDHSFMISVCKSSNQMQSNLKNIVEEIKAVNTDISEIINKITKECQKMEEKIVQLRERDNELQTEVTVIKEEVKLEMQASKQNIHQSKLKVAIKEDSLAATERTKSIKIARYEETHTKLIEVEKELDSVFDEKIDEKLKQIHATVNSLEKMINEANIDLQNELEAYQNVTNLYQELNGNVEKYEAMNKKQNEIVEKLQALLNEKQNVFFSLLKAKTDSESKIVYDNNMSLAVKLRDEMQKLEEIRKDRTEAQKQYDEVKEKCDECTSKLNEYKENINNIERNMKAAKEVAEANAPTKEIESLEEQIKQIDETIQQLNLNFMELKNDLEKNGKILNDVHDTSESGEIDANGDSPRSHSEDSFSVDLRSVISSLSNTCDKTFQPIRKTRSKCTSKSNSSKGSYNQKKRRTQ